MKDARGRERNKGSIQGHLTDWEGAELKRPRTCLKNERGERARKVMEGMAVTGPGT